MTPSVLVYLLLLALALAAAHGVHRWWRGGCHTLMRQCWKKPERWRDY